MLQKPDFILHMATKSYVSPEAFEFVIPKLPKDSLNVLDGKFDTTLDNLRFEIHKFDKAYEKPYRKVEAILLKHGAKTSGEMLAGEAKNATSLEAFTSRVMPGKILPVEKMDVKDFEGIPKLPTRENKGPKTHILVIETANRKYTPDEPTHHQITSHTARGAYGKLMGVDAENTPIIAIKENDENGYYSSRHAFWAAEARGEHVVISDSTGVMDTAIIPPSAKEVSLSEPDFREPLSFKLPNNVTIFKAAGNYGEQKINFQDDGKPRHLPTTVRVGASQGTKPEKYSEPGVALTANTPSYKGAPQSGTSISTPIVAAAFAALNHRYGLWEENPYGLTPQELRWTMTATAKLEKEQETTSIRPDGAAYDKKGGFGKLDVLAADELAAKLYEAKKKLPGLTSQPISQKYQLRCDAGQKPNAEGKYCTHITLSGGMIADNAVLQLKFATPKTGKPDQEKYANGVLQVGDANIPVNFSRQGQSTVNAFNGMYLPIGTHFTLLTDTPLEAGMLEVTGTSALNSFNPVIQLGEEILKRKSSANLRGPVVELKPAYSTSPPFSPIGVKPEGQKPLQK